MLVEIVLIVVTFFIFVYAVVKKPNKVHGIYSQPGLLYYPKKYIFYLLFLLKQHQQRTKITDDVGRGKNFRRNTSMFEEIQDVQEKGVDELYINGYDAKENYFVLRIARRSNGTAELWLTACIAEFGTFQHPIHPDTIVYNTADKSFSASGLKFQCIEPMRRWRIVYNGLMRQERSNKMENKSHLETLHVKFSFFWEAVTDKFDFREDICVESVATAVARQEWTKDFFQNLINDSQHAYEQCGEMRGVFEIQGCQQQSMVLKSVLRRCGGEFDWKSYHRYIIQYGWMEDGTFFNVSVSAKPNILTFLQCGYVSYPNGEMHPVKYSDLNLQNLGENSDPPTHYTFEFKAGSRSYTATVDINKFTKYNCGSNGDCVVYEGLSTYKVNGYSGFGISEFCYRNTNGENQVLEEKPIDLLSAPPLFEIAESEKNALCLPFTCTGCQCTTLVGGKGSQLALLTKLKSDLFSVPKGFCLTIAAFNLQMKNNQLLKNQVVELVFVASGVQGGDLKACCSKTKETFLSTPVDDTIKTCIHQQFKDLFGDDPEATYAVRSSATGEDGDELSAAGQMQTILGVKGLENLYTAVQKCWASNFDFPAVEYRRQHGQSVDATIAVVIQQMVPAAAAGVLFTREPLTGNPGKMVINASYGLGESVVSGSSEPDLIHVNRTWDDKLNIENKQSGSKAIKLSIKATGGTVEEAVRSDEQVKCCISDDVILRLAYIGVQLEKHFGDTRDIEWAVKGENIYLLQARPITTLDSESEWELLHEFDSPLASNSDLMTTANVSEMMPGAVTPLTYSMLFRAIEWSLQQFMVKQGLMPNTINVFKYLGCVCNHGLLNLHFVNGAYEERAIGTNYKMAHLAILGEVIEDITLEQLRNYHGTFPLIRRIINGIKNFRNLQASYEHTKNWEKILKTYVIGAECKTASDLYAAIDEDLCKYFQVFEATSCNSARSSNFAFLIMATLCNGKTGWTTEHYADVALLLSKCEDVYSADVPAALQHLGAVIADSDDCEEFVKSSSERAVHWLENEASGEVRQKYKEFLDRHGHRCIREAEFRAKSWQSEPTTLVTVLQSIVELLGTRKDAGGKSSTVNERIENIDDAIAKINTPLTSGAKFMLKKILPRARRAVGGREWGKSISIKMVEAFKKAYWNLAEFMVREGRLPDNDLLFFFTHSEIGELIYTRSGAMVTKAQRRRKILEKQMAMKFKRVNFGSPIAVEQNQTQDSDKKVLHKIKGLPVSRGEVKGTARVVTSLQDASCIELGDILIVPFTDVGWSPYFPLISGLVTEIGGLVSHGAVVAREYGLPCIVNCPDATIIFSSGDKVILNGTEGALEKIEE